MFPLVHYLINQNIFADVPHLMALGSIYPDIAVCAGIDRDYAHRMGQDFYYWCKANDHSALPLAQGIISHGVDPKGVDYYADEYWPGYPKGWCFMLGEAYLEQVAQVTKLPADFIWWKAHNFVEISYELITDQDHPDIKDKILAAINDQTVVANTAEILSAFHNTEKNKIIDAFALLPKIFSLEKITAQNLAEIQIQTIISNHQIFEYNSKHMATLLEQMSRDLKRGYYPFIEELRAKTADMLNSYQLASPNNTANSKSK